MQDLGDGGGLGCTVELFFLALDQLLSTSSEEESRFALYMGAFQTIISDWRKHRHSLGAQNLLLYITWSRPDGFGGKYPSCIIDAFLELLCNCFEGQTLSRIDEIEQQLRCEANVPRQWFWDRMLEAIGIGAQ